MDSIAESRDRIRETARKSIPFIAPTAFCLFALACAVATSIR